MRREGEEREGKGRGGKERGEGEGEKKPDCTVPTCPSSRDMMEQHLFQCVGCGADETLASNLCSSEKLNVSLAPAIM